MSLRLERVASLQPVAPGAWNALAGDSPFLRHEFLTALERSGCVGRRTAWQPAYLLAQDGAELVGAIPLYMKYDSRGEFVFDWGWADAYERSGRRYYPKLVAAVPFTPATGHAAAGPARCRRAARARAVDRRRARGGDRAPRLVVARAVPDRGGARAPRRRRPVEPQERASSTGTTTATPTSTTSSPASAPPSARRRSASAGASPKPRSRSSICAATSRATPSGTRSSSSTRARSSVAAGRRI